MLDIGPNPQGDLEPVAYERLKEIGAWMKVNGEAIYGTRPVAPYKNEKIRFTRQKSGAVCAIYLADEKETSMPESIPLVGIKAAKGTKDLLLGAKAELTWKQEGDRMIVSIPQSLRQAPPCRHAWSIKISAIEH